MTEESAQDEATRNLITRLADVGEEAIQRVGEMPGMSRLAEPLIALRERVDDLQRRMRGVDALERRLTDLERRVDLIEGPGAPTTEAEALSTTPPVAPAAAPPAPDPLSSVPVDDPTAGTAGAEETGLPTDPS